VQNENDVDGYTEYTNRCFLRKQLKPRALGAFVMGHYLVKVSLICFVILSTVCFGQIDRNDPPFFVDKSEDYLDSSQWVSLGNDERIGDFTRIDDKVFCGELWCGDVNKPLQEVDLSTFEVLLGNFYATGSYARDENYVYYPLETYCVDFEDCGVCYCTKYIIQDADPRTFKYLSKDYSTDGNIVFHKGEIMEGADGGSFKVIETPDDLFFGADKNFVYRYGRPIEGVKPDSFIFAKKNKTSD